MRARERAKHNVLIIFAIGMTMLMILPAIPFIDGASSATVYRFENESVQFKGTTAILSFGGDKYQAKWDIFKINPSANGVQPMTSSGYENMVQLINIGNLSQSQIVNKYQNSAVVKGSSKSLNVAEIYNFDNCGDSINSNIVLNNANNTSEIYSPAFSITTNNGSAVLSGFTKPMSLNGTSNMGQTVSFGNNYSAIMMGGLYISWLPDTSLFVSGSIQFTQTTDILSLFFNPISINPKGSYSIDPIIRPMRISGPPGGNGGGGSSPSIAHVAPTISSICVPDPAVVKGGTLCVKGAISPNAPSATITYRVFEYVSADNGGAWVNVGDKVITSPNVYGYSFNPTSYSADEVDFVVQNSYGTTVSNPVGIAILLQMSCVHVYDTNGNDVASYIVSADKTTNGWTDPLILYQTQVFEPSSCSSYGVTMYPHAVHGFSWTLSNDMNLDNTAQGNGYGVCWNHIKTYIAGGGNTLPTAESAILTIEIYALHVLDLGVTPDYNTFGTSWNCNSKFIMSENSVSYSLPGNSRCMGGNSAHYDHEAITTCYPTQGGSEVLMFGTVNDQPAYKGESTNYVTYAVTLQFIGQSYPAGYNTIICSSSSIVVGIGVPPT